MYIYTVVLVATIPHMYIICTGIPYTIYIHIPNYTVEHGIHIGKLYIPCCCSTLYYYTLHSTLSLHPVLYVPSTHLAATHVSSHLAPLGSSAAAGSSLVPSGLTTVHPMVSTLFVDQLEKRKNYCLVFIQFLLLLL